MNGEFKASERPLCVTLDDDQIGGGGTIRWPTKTLNTRLIEDALCIFDRCKESFKAY